MVPSSSQAARRLQIWCRISIVLYAGTTLVFLFLPGLLFAEMNFTGRLLGLPETPEPTEKFWLSLTISMMVMLCVCCAYVIRDPVRNADFCVPIVFGKIAGSLVALGAFLLWKPYPAHLTIVTTDVPMGVVTWILWRAVKAGGTMRTSSGG